MIKRAIVSTIFMVLGYECLARIVNKPIVLPTVIEIFNELTSIIGSSSFLEIVIATTIRTLSSLVIVFLISLLLGIIAGYQLKVRQYLSPLITFIRSVPTISVIIIFLMWFGRDSGPFMIIGFVVFPLLYELIVGAMDTVNSEYLDVCRLFGSTPLEKFRALYYPPILRSLNSGLQATLGLAFKVAVTAEVIAQSSTGIGKALNQEKTYLNMAGVFAWTLILILLVFGFEQLMRGLMRVVNKSIVEI